MIIGKLRKKDLIINMVNKIIHQPGFEPGFERWQRPVMTATLLMFCDDRVPAAFLLWIFLLIKLIPEGFFSMLLDGKLLRFYL